VINANLPRILHRFRYIAFDSLRIGERAEGNETPMSLTRLRCGEIFSHRFTERILEICQGLIELPL